MHFTDEKMRLPISQLVDRLLTLGVLRTLEGAKKVVAQVFKEKKELNFDDFYGGLFRKRDPGMERLLREANEKEKEVVKRGRKGKKEEEEEGNHMNEAEEREKEVDEMLEEAKRKRVAEEVREDLEKYYKVF